MTRRHVQQAEIVFVGFDFGAVIDLKSERGEDVVYLSQGGACRMCFANGLRASRHGHVHHRLLHCGLDLELLDTGLACVVGLLETSFDLIGEFAYDRPVRRREITKVLQGYREAPLAAQKFSVPTLQLLAVTGEL